MPFPHENRITSGPLSARVAIISERPGKEELSQKLPFIGASGDLLDKMLLESSLLSLEREPEEGDFFFHKRLRVHRNDEVFLTNVFHQAPPNGSFESWCAPKGIVVEEYQQHVEKLRDEFPSFPWPPEYSWPPLAGSGKYLRPMFLGVLPTLRDEINSLSECNIILALGAISCWALLGDPSIKATRGVTTMGTLVDKKILPTYHPAFILRSWEALPITLADFKKAQRQSLSPDLYTPPCTVWIPTSIEDLYEFDRLYLKDAAELSVDIETKMEQVRCVGISPDDKIAIVVPLIDLLKRGYSYWRDTEDEIKAILWLNEVLTRGVPKLGQNFNFDLQYLWEKLGIGVRNVRDDTMLMHHSLQPELEKSLGFLASLYCDRPAWKGMRTEADTSDNGDA